MTELSTLKSTHLFIREPDVSQVAPFFRIPSSFFSLPFVQVFPLVNVAFVAFGENAHSLWRGRSHTRHFFQLLKGAPFKWQSWKLELKRGNKTPYFLKVGPGGREHVLGPLWVSWEVSAHREEGEGLRRQTDSPGARFLAPLK